MIVEQLYTGCLAEAAYYIESKGEAVVIDPLRETKPYLDLAQKNGAKIKYILETHFHADFVSGHLDLAKATGASIVFGPTAQPKFEAHVAQDGELLKVGDIQIKVLHTPGHTMESTTYLLKDENGKDYAVFTGDTLFLGDVGRPDLAVKSDLSREDLAGFLFDSLRQKIMPLADEVIVYPGHGAGSACGKKMSSDTSGLLGDQKRENYALRADMTREEFIQEVTDGLVNPPQYFPKNAVMNKMGYDSFEQILDRGLRPLSVRAFKAAWKETGALIIDARSREEFPKGYIPGAMFVGLDGSFATWIGTLIHDLKRPILFVVEAGKEEEVVTRLARVGYDQPIGYLDGGIDAWVQAGEEVERVENISAEIFGASVFQKEKVQVVDVRKISEFESQHLLGANNIPLDNIYENIASFDAQKTIYLYCASGYRSLIAASILKTKGFSNIVNIVGGFKALQTLDLPLSRFQEQSVDL